MRTKKAIKNMITSFLSQIIAIICGLIGPRLILSHFGSTYNGIINSVTQFLSIASILRIGIAGATRVALYKTLANDDGLGTSRIVKATQIYMRKISIVIVVYTLCLAILFPLFSKSGLDYLDCFLLTLIVGISTFAEYCFGITNLTLLSADQSDYISNILNIFVVIANTILTAILIHFNANIFTVKFITSLVFLISPIMLGKYVKHRYKLDTNCDPDDSAIKGRKAVACHSIANIVHNNTDIIILTLFTNVKLVSVYSVYFLVVSKLKSMLQIFTGGMEAAFGSLWEKKEKEVLLKSFSAFEFIIFCFIIIVFSCTSILLLPFIELYTKGVTDIEYIRPDFAILIIISEVLFCIRMPYLLLVQATGSYEQTKNGAILEAAVNLISSIIFVILLGINGVIIGTILANLIRSIQYILFTSKKILNRSVKYIIYRIIFILTGMAIIFGIFFGLNFILPPINNWGYWILNGICVFVISVFVTIIIGFIFFRDDLIYLINKMKLFKRRK